jgi:hypothetical protein
MMTQTFWSPAEIEPNSLHQRPHKLDQHLAVLVIGRHICFGKGGGGGSSADPQVGKAALMQAKTGDDWLAFSKSAYDDSQARQAVTDGLNNQVTTQQLSDMKDASTRSNDQWDRYNTLFKPVEDRMVSDANNYDTPAAQAAAAATAKADVMSNASQAQEQNSRQMASMGISPTSGRFAGVDRSNDLSTALAAAGAENGAREQVKATGMALREGVANFGRGNTATAAQQVGLGLQAGNSAVNNSLAADASARANTNVMAQGFQGAQQGYGSQAGILSNQRQQNIAVNQGNQQAGAANTAAVGGLAAAGMMAVAF